MNVEFVPTKEQSRIIAWNGSAFVTACPGAGKTRVLVERARRLLKSEISKQGIAFLSFTEAAVSELEDRLRKEGLLLSTTLPSFIGTFDSFLWRFLVAPFGIPGSTARPRLIPDMESREVIPYANATPLAFGCFDRVTGKGIGRVIVVGELGHVLIVVAELAGLAAFEQRIGLERIESFFFGFHGKTEYFVVLEL